MLHLLHGFYQVRKLVHRGEALDVPDEPDTKLTTREQLPGASSIGHARERNAR